MNKAFGNLDTDLIKNKFNELDIALSELAKSDDIINYAPHINDKFYNTIDKLNEIKNIFNLTKIQGFDYFISIKTKL